MYVSPCRTSELFREMLSKPKLWPTHQVMETAFIYQGKLKGKRVRQARIYYIRDLDHKFYRITGGGGSE